MDKGVNEYGDGVAWFRGSLLGKGAFGSVYLATLKNPNSKYSYYPSLMAVKSAEVSASCSIQKEREVLTNIQGCNSLIRCYGDETTLGENGTMVYNLLLEYASAGTLTHKIKSSLCGKLPLIEVRSYARSILRGLRHIHNLGYVHCDLKPDNILLVPVKGTGIRAKIGDFGLAKREIQSKKRKLQPYWRGTPMYLSPEAVTDSVQDAPSDIWAFGCIVLEMLTGKPPWDKGEDEILKRIGEGKELPIVPNEVSKEAKDFLKCCFVRKSMFRFTAELLLDHPFLEGLSDGDGIEQVEEVEDLNGVESILVASLSNDEFSCSFGSNEGLTSYLSDDDGEEDLDDVSSNFAEEGKLRVEDIGTGLGQSNAKEISLEVHPKRRKDFAVGYIIPAAV